MDTKFYKIENGYASVRNDSESHEFYNPRNEDSENISIVAISHNQYALGDLDVDPDSVLNEAVADKLYTIDYDMDAMEAALPKSVIYKIEENYRYSDARTFNEYIETEYESDIDNIVDYDLSIDEKLEILEDEIVAEYIAMYEHSGYYIYLGQEGQTWDDSQIGIIFVKREDIINNKGVTIGNWREKATEILNREFDEYAKYCSSANTCFYVEIYDEKGCNIDAFGVVEQTSEAALQSYTNDSEFSLLDEDPFNKTN